MQGKKIRAILHQFSFPFLIDPTQRFTTIQTGRESKRSTQSSCHKMMHRPSSNSRPVPLTELKAYKPLSHVHAHARIRTHTFMHTNIHAHSDIVDTCESGLWMGVYAGVWKWIESFLFSGIFLFSQHTHTPRAALKARPRTHSFIQAIIHTHTQPCIYVCLFAHRCTCVCAKDNETLTHSHSLSLTHTIKVCTTTWYCYLSQ